MTEQNRGYEWADQKGVTKKQAIPVKLIIMQSKSGSADYPDSEMPTQQPDKITNASLLHDGSADYDAGWAIAILGLDNES